MVTSPALGDDRCSLTGTNSDCLQIRGPIYKISYDNLTIMPKLRSTYDGRLIYKTSRKGRKAVVRYDSLAKSSDPLR